MARPFDKFFKERPDHPALPCIQEIERHLPLFRCGRLIDVPAQRDAIEKCTILNAKLTVYSDHSEALRLYSNKIVGLAAFKYRAAFSRAVVGRDLGGKEDWLQQVEPLRWLQKETRRLVSVYDNDGRLDSNERVIHEQAHIDPLAQDDKNLSTIDRYSLKVVVHPNAAVEVENLEDVLKAAGLNPRQRKALMLRRNGEIMSRKHLSEWKRAERAMGRNRSELIRAITTATKKRVIRAPEISAGNHTGVVREGSAYTRQLANEDRPTPHPRYSEEESSKWFNATPPPIAPTVRKKKHLFKKVSTEK
jgi:hypothetical protein